MDFSYFHRIWDVENKRKQKTVIVIKSKERGARTKVNSCAYSTDGNLIAAACLDGAFHLYSTNSNFVRPNHSVQGWSIHLPLDLIVNPLY